MSSASVDFENNWPVITREMYRLPEDPESLEMEVDTLHCLGVNLVIIGALATAADAALKAGIDIGIALVMRQMQEREAAGSGVAQAAKGKAESILVPSRQLILPGSKDW